MRDVTGNFQIGPYQITGKLGEGGMGAVYRATDLRLRREVAIKVLPEVFAADGERLARFTREAQVLASLNHPNIATIYGVEGNAIVMELVEGEDLAGPVAVETALGYARQIAAGLEAAHEKGIVHRDLKPANIKITAQGMVKLLDFGLAKATENAVGSGVNPSLSPTVSLGMTQAGVILGTAAYMAPEQARGKVVDKRADIWAFGVVLYEMLTGKQLFGGGETIADAIASVMTREPDWSLLPEGTPAAVRRLLERCLRRDVNVRLRDIGEARILLDEPGEVPVVERPGVESPADAGRGRLGWAAAAVCAVAAVVAGVGWWRATLPKEQPLQQLSIELGAEWASGTPGGLALSPDGARVAFKSGRGEDRGMLAIRELNKANATRLAGTEGANYPFFSPDGEWIGFFAEGKLKKVPVSGGVPVVLADAPVGRGADWGEDGSIVFAGSTAGLSRVSENGGQAELLVPMEPGEQGIRGPRWLPGGGAVLFASNTSTVNWDLARIDVYSVRERRRKTLVRGGYAPRYAAGYLIYVREGKLFGMRFDAKRLIVSGTAVALLEDLAAWAASGAGQYDFGGNGMLVYAAGKMAPQRSAFGWLDVAGRFEAQRGAPADVYSNPHLSPDGTRLVIGTGDGALQVWDFARETMTRLPATGIYNWFPVWMPDGKHVISQSVGKERAVWWQQADGAGEAVKLFAGGENWIVTTSVSPDGRYLAYCSGPPGQYDIYVVELDTSDPSHPRAGKPEAIVATGADERSPAFSPDGRWLAYSSAESGAAEIYVRPFPKGAGRWTVSAGGGEKPIWGPGGTLFFEGPEGRVMVVNWTASGGAFSPGKPRRWTDIVVGRREAFSRGFDVAADGKRIVIPRTPTEEQTGTMRPTVLLNFFDELRRRIR